MGRDAKTGARKVLVGRFKKYAWALISVTYFGLLLPATSGLIVFAYWNKNPPMVMWVVVVTGLLLSIAALGCMDTLREIKKHHAADDAELKSVPMDR